MCLFRSRLILWAASAVRGRLSEGDCLHYTTAHRYAAGLARQPPGRAHRAAHSVRRTITLPARGCSHARAAELEPVGGALPPMGCICRVLRGGRRCRGSPTVIADRWHLCWRRDAHLRKGGLGDIPPLPICSSHFVPELVTSLQWD